MEHRDAVSLIEPAVRGRGGAWADLGAGSGTFTRALHELLSRGSRVYAVDNDAHALASLGATSTLTSEIVPVVANFNRDMELPGAEPGTLDGILLANSLHFVRNGDGVLARLVRWLRPGGRVVLVEYDQRAASRWVPYPIASERWPEMAAAAGLTNPAIVGTRPSEYQGVLYAAIADRPDEAERES